jgi:hypothetical protein
VPPSARRGVRERGPADPGEAVVGLTATPYRRDGLDELIHHQLGPIRHTITPPPAGTLGAVDVPERLLTVHPTSYEYVGEADPSKPGGMAAIYRDLVADEARRDQVVGDVLEALERGRNCLVLTQWKDHVESLVGKLRDELLDLVPPAQPESELLVHSLVDELTYRVRSNAGTAVFRQMPRTSFLIARLVRVGDEWMFSGPTIVRRASERDVVLQLAWSMSMSAPEAVFRNLEKLARGWELQEEDRQRFIRFFGSDLVVLPTREVEQRMVDYYSSANREVRPDGDGDDVQAPRTPLPPELEDCETVGLIYDEVDGLGYYADFALVEAVFAEPELVRKRLYRQRALDYLNDDSIEPSVLRRLADRDPEKASSVFRRLLKRPRFDWTRDGDQLLRTVKADYFAREPLPRITPASEPLAAYAQRA